jgi:hypothetical protein
MPSRSIAKIHGSDRRPQASVTSVGLSWLVSVRTGWSCPSTSWSWYGSTLMKVTSGLAFAIGLKVSSVGPHCLLVQNFGVAKTSMIGLCDARASATEV